MVSVRPRSDGSWYVRTYVRRPSVTMREESTADLETLGASEGP